MKAKYKVTFYCLVYFFHFALQKINCNLYRDGYWRDAIKHEEEGKFNSIIKGLEMECVASIPVTDRVAENLNSAYFNDPFLMAKGAYVNDPRNPQFDKKNVYGRYTIKTARERELEQQNSGIKRSSLFNNYNDDNPLAYIPIGNNNMYNQSLMHPTNELFETKLKEKYKGATGVSIMSGEIDKTRANNKRKTYDGEKLPYVGSSIDISQPDIYRYEVKSHYSRNNPIGQSATLSRLENSNRLGNTNFGQYNDNHMILKSKYATIPKKINSVERILDWKPKEASQLNLTHEREAMMMENSLGNTIPYRQHSTEHKPYAVGLQSQVDQYHSKILQIEAPRRDFKLPSLSLSRLSY